jgi:hypothetical protein
VPGPGFETPAGVSNINAVADNGCLFSARDQQTTNPAALTGLTLSNVTLTIGRPAGTPATWAQRDYRPIDAGAPSPSTIPAPVAGLVFEHVAGATLDGVSVTFVPPAQPYWAGPGGAGVCVNATADSVVVGAPACSTAGAAGAAGARRGP